MDKLTTLAVRIATHGTIFYHRTAINSDRTAVRVRVTGVCKTWKTRPDDFRLPIKYGLYQSFAITPDNIEEWRTKDPTTQNWAKRAT